MARKMTNRLKRESGRRRPRRSKKSPEFRIVARSILAAFQSAPSPDVTVGELTDIAVVIIMDDGYGALEAREAIEHLLELEDSRYH